MKKTGLLLIIVVFMVCFSSVYANEAAEQWVTDTEIVLSLNKERAVWEHLSDANTGYTCASIITSDNHTRYECLKVSAGEVEAFHYIIDFNKKGKIETIVTRCFYAVEVEETRLNDLYDFVTKYFETVNKGVEKQDAVGSYILNERQYTFSTGDHSILGDYQFVCCEVN